MRLEQLETAINEKKDEMIKLGMSKGLQNEETIYCSQALDKLLNDYNRLLLEDKHSKTITPYDGFYSLLRSYTDLTLLQIRFSGAFLFSTNSR